MTIDVEELHADLSAIPLVDHHVHACLKQAAGIELFGQLLSESSAQFSDGQSRLDSQAGFAVAAICGQRLAGAAMSPADYWQLRSRWDEADLQRNLLRGAGVSDWLIDTGHGADELIDLDDFSERSAGVVHEIIRLELLAEELLRAAIPAADFADAFRNQLHGRLAGAVGFKSIAAYRCGFDIDWSAPTDAQVAGAIAALSPGERARITDPVIISFIVNQALLTRRPVQLHVGLGDRDVDLARSNPLLLRKLLITAEHTQAPVALLHCWPYEREAGYLCQNFASVYMDVGLTQNLTGASGIRALERALELCPFSRLLYSSDAWGVPELHYLGAFLWRRQFSELAAGWVRSGFWLPDQAIRVAKLMSRDNAIRLYGLA